MSKTAEMLFAYLRDALYSSGTVQLDIDALEEEYKNLGRGLSYVMESIHEARHFATSLSRGELDTSPPPATNELAAPLKSLHASLLHLSWQTAQVAQGDYSQQVDFMGEFSTSFNSMTQQLEERRTNLENQVATALRQKRALERHHALLESITNELTQWIVVLDTDRKQELFRNRAAIEMADKDPALEAQLWEELLPDNSTYSQIAGAQNLALPVQDGSTRYIAVTAYPLDWHGHQALVFVMRDVSNEKNHEKKLENFAYRDALTGNYNRLYGTEQLQQWLNEQRLFSLCFADLDNLKTVNDIHGHAEGDRYIAYTGSLLCEAFPNAVVCRLGGDEFMVLVPEMPRQECEQTLHHLRNTMLHRTETDEVDYPSSISYGVVDSGGSAAQTASELLAEADEKMYRFKRAHKMGRR